MTGPCCVDANVFVYARDPRDPAKRRRAIAWLDHLWSRQLGRTSIQVLAESYAVLKRLGGAAPEELWASVAKYFAWSPHAVDEVLLRRAREIEQRWRISWRDSMVVAAAQLQDCPVLLTEDLQDGCAYGTVTVRSPFSFSAEEPMAAYAAAPKALSRHRPRGRPRTRPQPPPA